MTHPMLQFSLSSNGDQWYLARGNSPDEAEKRYYAMLDDTAMAA